MAGLQSGDHRKALFFFFFFFRLGTHAFSLSKQVLPWFFSPNLTKKISSWWSTFPPSNPINFTSTHKLYVQRQIFILESLVQVPNRTGSLLPILKLDTCVSPIGRTFLSNYNQRRSWTQTDKSRAYGIETAKGNTMTKRSEQLQVPGMPLWRPCQKTTVHIRNPTINATWLNRMWSATPSIC